jgi:hypothetical protein
MMSAHLSTLADSEDGGAIFTARRELLRMPWLDDDRLITVLEFALEEVMGVASERARRAVGTMRSIYESMAHLVWLNEPVVIRFRSSLATWSVDPDDPMGFQTTSNIPRKHIQVLFENRWHDIKADSLDPLMRRIYGGLANEDRILNPRDIAALRDEMHWRSERGFMGAPEAHRETPQQIAEMLGLDR